MTTKDLGGGWTIGDPTRATYGAPALRAYSNRERKYDGIVSVEVVRADLEIERRSHNDIGDELTDYDYIPLDALAELLRAAGWTCERGQG